MADEELDNEVKAISTLLSVLKPLDDKARIHVLEFVLKRLEINLGISDSKEQKSPRFEEAPAGSPQRTSQNTEVSDIRSLAEQKRPRTVNEKVALVAYYLKNLAHGEERRDYITSEDIGAYFVQADFELPTAPPYMTITHAKNAGYLNVIEKGKWKLNAVGHNVVAHKLPEAGGNSQSTRRSGRTTKRKK